MSSYNNNDMGANMLANQSKVSSRDSSISNTPRYNSFQEQRVPSFNQMPMSDNSNNYLNNNNMGAKYPMFGKTDDSDNESEVSISVKKVDDNNSYAESEYSNSTDGTEVIGLSEEEVKKEKRMLLFRLKRYEKKGYKLSRNWGMHSSLEDLRAEFESIRRLANLEQGIQVSKNMLISGVSLIEYLNNRFDPMDVVLDGWSEEVHDDVDEGKYDEVLEELYYKYYDKISTGPEIKLLMMVGGSAVKFHMTKTLLKTMVPDAETLLKQNPNLKDDLMGVLNKNGINPDQQINNMVRNGTVSGLSSKPQTIMREPDDVAQILRDIEREVDSSDDEGSVSKKRGKRNVLEMTI